MPLLTIDQVQHISVDEMQHTYQEAIIAYLRQSVDWIIHHINTMDNMTAMFIAQQNSKIEKPKG